MIVPQGRGKRLCLVALLSLLVPASGRAATDSNNLFASPSHFLDTVKQDYEDLYFSPEHWMHLGIAFGAGGIVANTKMDRELQDWYQQHIRTKATNRAADVATIFGTGQYMVPVALGAAFLGDRLMPGDDGDSPLGTWGSRRACLYHRASRLARVTMGDGRTASGRGQFPLAALSRRSRHQRPLIHRGRPLPDGGTNVRGQSPGPLSALRRLGAARPGPHQ